MIHIGFIKYEYFFLHDIYRISIDNNKNVYCNKIFSILFDSTLKSNNQVNLILKKALEGPQDVELDLSMTVFTNGMPRGKSVAKLFLFVSQYTY